MAETKLVDYVKIYCRSGKGGKGSMHLRHVKYNPNGGPDGGMVERAEALYLEVITIIGRYFTCAINATFLLNMEEMEEETSVTEAMVRISTSMFLVAQWCITQKQENLFAIYLTMGKKLCY